MPALSRNYSILVVDDATENVEFVDRLLKSENFTVYKSYSAQTARSILLTEEIDLILLDVNMPDQNGYSFCKELREIDKFSLLPILFITAVDREIGFQEAIANGGDDFISKPFHKKELIAKIRAFLRIKDLQDHLMIEKVRYEKELKAARKVQEQMIPAKSIEWNGIKASTYLHPLFQIGGDFVDIWTENNELHAVIADCSGHGPSAALIGVMFKMQLLNCQVGSTLAEKVDCLRSNLRRILPEDYFITLVYLIISPDRSIQYIKCGHPEPIYYKDSIVNSLPGQSPLIIDLNLIPQDHIQSITLEKGTTLLLYTDGMIEATNSKLEMFQTQGLMDLFKTVMDKKEPDIFNGMINGVLEYCGDAEPEDDMAMLCIQF
ncbi:PP2C family protein-serine/threonine phosphatase [Leptospira sp. GIMC2001]|uniref:PP2C family protein-serine/threonine phosphatase n=1 Tax=Leptospira sp. GIMC2001 TaxID=1513297 RepID=UPI003FA5BD77